MQSNSAGFGKVVRTKIDTGPLSMRLILVLWNWELTLLHFHSTKVLNLTLTSSYSNCLNVFYSTKCRFCLFFCLHILLHIAGQKEVLFPPFLDLQPVGFEQIEIVADMVVSKVRVNVHLNEKHKLQGLQNTLERKKPVHIAQFEYLLNKLEQHLLLLAQNDQTHYLDDTNLESLRESCLSLVDMFLHQCNMHLRRHQTIDALDLLDYSKFRIMIMNSIGVLDLGEEETNRLRQSRISQTAAIANLDLKDSTGWQELQARNLSSKQGHELAEMTLQLCKLNRIANLLLRRVYCS